jgi:hypothetical protein
MRKFQTAAAVLAAIALTALAATPGEARARHRSWSHYYPQHAAERAHGARSWISGPSRGDAAYALAVRQGGPCGLTVERMVFGRSDHTIGNFNPWLARDWGPHRFPQASPAPGLVAVWKNGRHVGVIEEVRGDGSFSVTGSVRIARVTLAQVWVVDPHGGRVAEVTAPSRPRYARRRYVEAASYVEPRRRRYAYRYSGGGDAGYGLQHTFMM